MATVSAMSLILENGARWTPSHFRHQMKMPVAQAPMPLFAAVRGSVWRASVSVRTEKTQMKNILETTVTAATLTVHTGTAGIMCDD